MRQFIVSLWNTFWIPSLTKSIRFHSVLLVPLILGCLSHVTIIRLFHKCYCAMSTLKRIFFRRTYVCKLGESVFDLSFFTFYSATVWHIFTGVPFRCIGSYVR